MFKYSLCLFLRERERERAERKSKALVLPVYVSALTYGNELWVVTKKMKLCIQAAEMSLLRRDGVRSLATSKGAS